jgi:hypothetical protein
MKKAQRDEQLEGIDDIKPIVRSILAFALYLRFGTSASVEDCYKTADRFNRATPPRCEGVTARLNSSLAQGGRLTAAGGKH